MSTSNAAMLNTALADPTIAALADSDAAAALSAPTLTPRPGWITGTTLSSAGVWGFAKWATFLAGLNAAIAAGQAAQPGTTTAMLGADAAALLAMLNGSGINASDPQVGAIGHALVTAGLVSQADLTAALNVTSYRCGGVIAAQDVTNARALIALQRAAAAGWARVKAAMQSAISSVTANPSAGVTLTTSDLTSAFGGN